MKKSKKVLIIIGAILIVSILVGIVLINSNEKKNKTISKSEVNTEEDEGQKTINVVLDGLEQKENETNEEQQDKIEEESILEEQLKESDNQDKQKSPISNIDSNNSVNTKPVTTSNNNGKVDTKQEVQRKPLESTKVEQTQVETPKQEESKPVENKTVEIPKQTTPVREYKANQTYINKLKNTITTEVTSNLDSLKKYGITDVSQYKIIDDDSSICACYGGNRNGWTYANVSAYNTFKSSILKGTYLKIYAVDEYYNGEYIQTLCYYGH